MYNTYYIYSFIYLSIFVNFWIPVVRRLNIKKTSFVVG